MGSIDILGETEPVDRAAFDLRRMTPSEIHGVCHAPWVNLHINTCGQLTPCRHSYADKQESAAQTSNDWFRQPLQHSSLERLRERFAKYQVKAEQCRTCVSLWLDGCYKESPAQAEFDPFAVKDPPEALQSLSLELAPMSVALVQKIEGALDRLQQLELIAEDAVDAPKFTEFFARVRQWQKQRQSLKVKLRLAGPIPETLPIPVDRLTLVHPMLQAVAATSYRQAAKALLGTLDPDQTECCLEVLVNKDNWFHLPLWTEFAANLRMVLLPVLTDKHHPLSLATLSADMLSALHSVLAAWLASDHKVSLQQARTDQMLSRLKIWQIQNAGRAMAQDQLAFPGLNHPILEDEARAEALLCGLLRVYSHPRLAEWFADLLAADAVIEAGKNKRCLRLIALWHASVFEDLDTLTLLRRIFETPTRARELAAADLETLGATELNDWASLWHKQFNLKNLRERTGRFEVATRRKAGSGERRVTVLIPSYQHETFIKAAIESVLGQELTDFDLLVADDQSADRTVEVAESFDDDRITVRVNPKNLGLGGSVARALRQIKTPYVALLNSDDLFHSERLSHCLKVLEENLDLDLVATNLSPIDERDHVLDIENSSPVFDGKLIHDWLTWFQAHQPGAVAEKQLLPRLLEGNFLLTSSNLFGRTDFFRRHQEQFLHQEFCLDWQLFLSAAVEHKLHYIPEPLLGYRLHGGNTVWFNEEREWRYYVESNQVVARTLAVIYEQGEQERNLALEQLLSLFADHADKNSGNDWAGVTLGLFLERAGFTVKDLRRAAVTKRIQQLNRTARSGRDARRLMDEFGRKPAELYRMRGERPYLLKARNLQEGQADRLARLDAELLGALRSRAEIEGHWHKAEAERDFEIQGKAGLYQEIGELKGEAEAAGFEARERQRERDEARKSLDTTARQLESTTEELQKKERTLVETRDRLSDAQTEIEHTKHELDRATGEIEELKTQIAALAETQEQLLDALHQRTFERDQLSRSPEYRSGHLLLNKLKMRRPLQWLEHAGLKTLHRLQLLRMKWGRKLRFWHKPKYRAVATACWNFPIYSQTFVYQELTQLVNQGFDLRFVYSKLDPRDYLAERFSGLWSRKRRLLLHRKIHQGDYAYYKGRMPDKVAALTGLIAEHGRLSEEDLVHHDNFLQAFSYTRMVEAHAADYLHSYFFYDRSLMSLVAGYLLDLPRGVSCYADHLMEDYELKLVNLHLKLCDLIIATSARIKRELLQVEPSINPDKILVKPNAINADKFPVIERDDPPPGQPYRLVGINRIEPKKGLEYLVDAMKILKDREVNVELHLCGQPDHGIAESEDYHNRLCEQIERLGLWGTVHMEGRQNEEGVLRFLEISQLFMAPFVETDSGDKDGIPTALLEAMSTGLPAVATDAGSMVEVVEHGEEGVIVDQGNSEALADAIQELLENKELRGSMSRKAAEKARAKFDVKVCEQIFHHYLAEVLEGRTRKLAENEG